MNAGAQFLGEEGENDREHDCARGAISGAGAAASRQHLGGGALRPKTNGGLKKTTRPTRTGRRGSVDEAIRWTRDGSRLLILIPLRSCRRTAHTAHITSHARWLD